MNPGTLERYGYSGSNVCKKQARTQGGALDARASPPRLKTSSAQKRPKEEREVDTKECTLRYNKIKTKKVMKKEEKSKRKAIK